MTRRFHILVGLIAATLHLVAIGSLAGYIAKSDWVFGHYQGPASLLYTALWTAGIAVLATLVWVFMSADGKPASSRSTTPRTYWRRLRPLPTIALLALLLPACVIMWTAVQSLPAARSQSRLEHLSSGSPTVTEIIEALESPDENLRWAAAQAVANCGAKSMQIGQAQDKLAIDTQNLLADREQVPALVAALIAALNESDPRRAGGQLVSCNAARALGVIGLDAQPAVPTLITAVRVGSGTPESDDEPDPVRGNASDALTRIGPAGIEALIECLSDENPHVRLHAAGSLGSAGPQAKAGVAALMEVLEDDSERVRLTARVALDRIAPDWKRAIESE